MWEALAGMVADALLYVVVVFALGAAIGGVIGYAIGSRRR